MSTTSQEEKKNAKQPVVKGFENVEISNADAVSLLSALEKMGDYEVPFWWTIARNKKNLKEVVTAYEDNRSDIIKKLAKKNEKGETVAKVIGNMAVPDFGDNTKEAEKLLTDLADEIVTVQLKPLKYDEVKNIAIKPNIMEPMLGTIIRDDNEG